MDFENEAGGRMSSLHCALFSAEPSLLVLRIGSTSDSASDGHLRPTEVIKGCTGSI